MSNSVIVTSPEQIKDILKEIIAEISPPPPPQQEDEIMNLDEASAFLKIKKGTIYNMVGQGLIPHYKPGKNLLFFRSELRTWLEGHRK